MCPRPGQGDNWRREGPRASQPDTGPHAKQAQNWRRTHLRHEATLHWLSQTATRARAKPSVTPYYFARQCVKPVKVIVFLLMTGPIPGTCPTCRLLQAPARLHRPRRHAGRVRLACFPSPPPRLLLSRRCAVPTHCSEKAHGKSDVAKIDQAEGKHLAAPRGAAPVHTRGRAPRTRARGGSR